MRRSAVTSHLHPNTIGALRLIAHPQRSTDAARLLQFTLAPVFLPVVAVLLVLAVVAVVLYRSRYANRWPWLRALFGRPLRIQRPRRR